MPVVFTFVILIAFLGTMYPQMDIPEGEMRISPKLAGMEHLDLKYTVEPLSESTFTNVVKQQYDYSCGSAALATLLNHYLNEQFTEPQVIQGLMQYGEIDKIQQRRAFSLLDMKRFVEVLGYHAAGYTAEFDDLKALDKPAIVPVEVLGYRHFVVLRGIYGEHVFVADPYRGNTSYTTSDFLKAWDQKIVFIVSSEAATKTTLMLRNEDLRIVDIGIINHAMAQKLPLETVEQQQQFIESMGKKYFKTLN